MKPLKFFLPLFFLIGFLFNASAYDVRVYGTVINGNGEPVPYAYMEVGYLSDTIYWSFATDSIGVYDFTFSVPDGYAGDFYLGVFGADCEDWIDTLLFIDDQMDLEIDFIVCEFEYISDTCVPYFYYYQDESYYMTLYFISDDPSFYYNFTDAFIDYGDGSQLDTFAFGYAEHTYEQEGIYYVTVDAYSLICQDFYSFEQEVYVYGYPDTMDCFADFFYYMEDTTNWNFVTFVNYSYASDSIVEAFWDFGDGDTMHSNDPVVYHEYSEGGEYWVTLEIITESGCADVWDQPIWIGDLDSLWFDYECEALFFTDYLSWDTVSFIDISWPGMGRITSYYWDFGDGDISVEPNPIHIYQDTGIYLVTLHIQTDNICESEFSEYVFIFDDLDTSGYVLFYPDEGSGKGAGVNFHNLSKAGGSWEWQFGDSKSVVVKGDDVVFHSYSKDGNYTVKLTDAETGRGYGMDILVSNNKVTPLKGYAFRPKSGGNSEVEQLAVKAEDITVYPVPATDELTVTANDNNISTLKIYSVSGQLIKSFDVNSQQTKIDIRDLTSGVYILKIDTEKGERSLKLVK